MAIISTSRILLALSLLASLGAAAPAPSSVISAPAATNTVPYASDDPNGVLWMPEDQTAQPAPIRGSLGTTDIGPQNVELDRQNPDLLAPPTTDHGTVYV
jgi:hypothetical protein